MSEINVEEERMKMHYIEFTTEETDGINVNRKSSSVRGNSLEDCLEQTRILHGKEMNNVSKTTD